MYPSSASRHRVPLNSRQKVRNLSRLTRGRKRHSSLATEAISSQLSAISSHAVQRVPLLSARLEAITSFSWDLGTP